MGSESALISNSATTAEYLLIKTNFDVVSATLETKQNKLVCFSEAWLNQGVEPGLCKFVGFKSFRCTNRTRRGEMLQHFVVPCLITHCFLRNKRIVFKSEYKK